MTNTSKAIKDFLLFSRIGELFRPFSNALSFTSNASQLTEWIGRNKDGLIMNDFYSPKRVYEKRYQLYEKVLDHCNLDSAGITYLEFGVASGSSFKWWIDHNRNPQSRFLGFDTFEGLPEDWGSHYKKGDMSFRVPEMNDSRADFYKGLFQETLNKCLDEEREALKGSRLIIHMDADLFSSTIFVLSQLYPFIKKGDIVFFDEFNVPNHEFNAFNIFTKSFYVNLKLIGAVNNYYQTAFIVE